MRKLATINLLCGFLSVFFVASCGLFLRDEVIMHFLHEVGQTYSWNLTLLRTAHAHGNVFGIMRILFGLSLSYSASRYRSLVLQSTGFASGTFAMSVLLFFEASAPVNPTRFSCNQLLIGVCLSVWLIAVFWHCYGLCARIWRF